jgi:hypothetical protein
MTEAFKFLPGGTYKRAIGIWHSREPNDLIYRAAMTKMVDSGVGLVQKSYERVGRAVTEGRMPVDAALVLINGASDKMILPLFESGDKPPSIPKA